MDAIIQNVMGTGLAADAWFKRNLRCTKPTYMALVRVVQLEWVNAGNRPLHWNTVFHIPERVAVAMYYYASGCALHTAGAAFGMGKSSTVKYVEQVRSVLVRLARQYIKLPANETEWYQTVDQFEEVAGYPLVVGAVDGTLFEIERPEDHEGWYCRKGFTAINMQAIIDGQKRFVSFSMRPGSQNDNTLWSRSSFGRRSQTIIPPGTHILGDAGYFLRPWLMAPYSKKTEDPRERHYNTIHSRTRIAVEIAFGWLKTASEFSFGY